MKTIFLRSLIVCAALGTLVVNTAVSSAIETGANNSSGSTYNARLNNDWGNEANHVVALSEEKSEVLASIITSSITEYKIEPADNDAYNFAYMNGVAIDGTKAIVGSYSDGAMASSGGSAYIFSWDGSSWTQQQKLFASDVEEKDWFGSSVDIQGSIAVVGAPGYSFGATTPGSVYVIKYNGTGWAEAQILNSSDGVNEDRFGKSVSIDGDYILIGAPGSSATQGSAYVFYYNGTTWEEQAILTPDDQYIYDSFGYDVTLSGTTAIVANTGDDDMGDGAGAVYIFERSGTTWTQTQKLTASDGVASDNFGFSVSFDGSTIAVCAPAHDSDLGKIYTFTNNGSAWAEGASIDGTVADVYFGHNVSVDNGRLLAGEREDNTQTSKAGRAIMYLFDGTNWSVDNTYYASDAGFYNRYGSSVDLDGENAIIGAFSDNSAYVYYSAAAAQVAADFSADVTSGTAPLAVQFTDASTGTPTSWAWDFDNDGNTDATTQNPGHTYSVAGTYTVSLTVSDGTSSDTETKTDYITVSAATTGDYATLPYSEAFDNDWIDGESTRDLPSGAWSSDPYYSKNSWRRDDDGVLSGGWGSLSGGYTPAGANSTSHSARFHSFGASSGTKGMLDLRVDFSSVSGTKELSFWYINSTGSDVLNVYVSTDGGENFSNALVTKTTTSGWENTTMDLSSYTASEGVVRFEAVSDYGYSDIGLDEVSISGTASTTLAADFSASATSIAVGASVNYTDQTTGSPTSWAWTFEGGTPGTSADQNPTGIVYSTAGTYDVTLVATNADGSDTEVKTDFITVTASGGSESENNDTYDVADAIAINSSLTGVIDNATDIYDWFKVTIPYDGSLTFVGIPEASVDLALSLYDANGTSYLHGCNVCGGTGANDTIYQHNLKAGSYYLQLSGTAGSYTIKNIFAPTSIPEGNDAESNDTYDVALSMGLNESNTGHLGFFSSGSTDYYDWYKVTIPYDGSLTFVGMPESSLDLAFSLYDADGTSYLHGCNQCGGLGVNDTIYQHNFKAGTYYLQVGGSGYGSYTLKNSFVPTSIPEGNDAESNDTYDVAIAMGVNGSNTGHLGFFSNGSTDYYDWYKVAIPYDGSLTFVGMPESSLDLVLNLYDADGTSYLHGCNQCGGSGVNDTIYQHNFKAGTYYVQLGGSGYGSYTLKNIFVATALADGNDAEPNDTYDLAISMEMDGSKTGHIGYFGNAATDYYDWYAITVSSGDVIDFVGDPEATLDLNLHLYGTDGSSYLHGCTDCGGQGENETLSHEFSTAGTYYLQLSASGYGSYTLTNELTPAITADFSANVTTGGAPLAVTFTDLTTGATTWSWSFGDGNTSDVQNPVHTYTTAGTYDVSLTVSDGTNSDTETKTDYITVSPSTVAYATLPYSQGFDGDWINGDHTRDLPSNNWTNDPSSGLNSWRRDDDGVLSGAWGTLSGAYTPAGANSTSHSARFHSFGASTGAKGNLDLHVDFSSIVGSKTLTFWYHNASGTDVLKVYVSSDGGANFGSALITKTTTSAWENVSIDLSAYTASQGVIRFEATSDFGSTDIGLDEVSVSAPAASVTASFSADVTSGTAPLTVTFTDASTASNTTISTWAWDFDNDGNTDEIAQNPSHTYSAAGTYTVSLTVSDGTNSDTETKTDYITVSPSTSTVTYASLPFSEDFDSDWIDVDDTRDVPSDHWVNTPAHGSNSWRRDDDGVLSGGWGTLSGSYTPAGANSTSHSARFHSFGASSGLTGTLDLHVDFSSLSGTKAVTFWYINEGGSDELNIYVSTNGGTSFGDVLATGTTTSGWEYISVDLTAYTASQGVIRFEAVSDYGYSDMGLDEVSVGAPTASLVAAFSADVTSGLAPLTVSFTDASTATNTSITSWAWDFDHDGSTDETSQHPTYTFSAADTYTVSLTVSDGTRSDTETKTDYITVVEPLAADFSADVTSGIAPLTVQFTDATTGDPTSWAWDFDNDGTTDATGQHPSYVYQAAGVYTVKLVVTNALDSDELILVDLIEVTDETTLSVEELDINIYPNPATDVITFKGMELDATVRILNLDGKMLIEQEMGNRSFLDISSLQSGFYIIQIEGRDGIATHKLIKK